MKKAKAIQGILWRRPLRLILVIFFGLLQVGISIAFKLVLSSFLADILLPREALLQKFVFLLLIMFSYIAVGFTERYQRHGFTENLRFETCMALLRKLLQLPGTRKEEAHSDLNLLTQDLGMLYGDYYSQIPELWEYGLASTAGILLLVRIQPWLALVLVLAVFLILFAGKVKEKEIQESAKAISQKNKDYLHALTQTMEGYEVLKYSGASEETIADLQAKRRAALAAYNRNRFLRWITYYANTLIMTLANLAAMAIIGLEIEAGRATAADMFLAVQLIRESVLCIQSFMMTFVSLLSSKPVLERSNELLALPSEEDLGEAHLSHRQEGGAAIVLENLGFSYGERLLFSGLNYAFEQGKAYAIVGPSGCGKSTLLAILHKQLQPTEGQIFWKNTAYGEYSQKTLYENLSVLQQKPFLLNESLEENIYLYGERLPEQDYKALLAKTQLTKFAEQAGDRALGDFGDAISGGEMQRIGLARALRKNPSVLLLDEPTAGLDVENAKAIEELIFELDGITRIVVTHHAEEGYLARFDRVIRLG